VGELKRVRANVVGTGKSSFRNLCSYISPCGGSNSTPRAAAGGGLQVLPVALKYSSLARKARVEKVNIRKKVPLLLKLRQKLSFTLAFAWPHRPTLLPLLPPWLLLLRCRAKSKGRF
jgi:hypothetical protein